MIRKLTKWLLALGVVVLAVPGGACFNAAVNGLVQSFEVCDVINCQDSNYVIPCRFLECGRPVREIGWGEPSYTDNSTTH